MDPLFKTWRSAVPGCRTPASLGVWFREVAAALHSLPRTDLPRRASAVMIRVFNAGHDKYKKLLPALASAPAAPPAAALDATLGVLLSRSAEIAGQLAPKAATATEPKVKAKPAAKAKGAKKK